MSIQTKWNKDILSKINESNQNTTNNRPVGNPVVESFELFNAKSYYEDCKKFIHGFKTKYVVEIIQEFLNVMACPFTSLDQNIEQGIQKMVDGVFMMECAKNENVKPIIKKKRKKEQKM